jgi:hypothetical protein
MAKKSAEIEVEVVKPYRDLEKSMLFYVGEKHKVTEARASELEQKGLVKRIIEKREPE